MLKLYIPTRGRAAKQLTFNNLPPAWQRRTKLLVDASEAADHKDYPHIVLPREINKIGKVRQWILDNHKGPKLAMLDDDLRFDTRRTDDRTKFKPSTVQEVEQMLESLEAELDAHAHAGIVAREGGNRHIEPLIYNTRMLRVLAYNTKLYKKAGARYDRLTVMEDFDVTLQLLRKGYPNVVLCNWVQGQGMSGAAGGCSTYRTMGVQEQGARGLQRMHPEFVRLVEKTTKTAWGGATRTDVVISWKKAHDSSIG